MYKLGQYVQAASLVHDSDPRIKIVALVLLSLLILRLNLLGLGLVYIIVLGISLMAYISWSELIRASRPVWPFFIILFAIYLLFTPGVPLVDILPGRWSISREGVASGIIQIGRFLLLVLAAEILTMTTSTAQLTVGLHRLLQPLRVVGISSHNLAFMVSLAFRFVPVLQWEFIQMQDAQAARGGNYHSLNAKLKGVKYMAFPLILNIVRRSEELITAIEARGYQPGTRSYLYEPKLSRNDYVAIVLTFMAAVAAWWWRAVLIS